MQIPNQQWTYVMMDAENGEVVGTDNEKVAKEFARGDTIFVLDVKRCIILQTMPDGDVAESSIPEQTLFKF